MTTGQEAQARVRAVGHVHCDDDVVVVVDHVYMADGSFPCDDCGQPGHDPGMVGMGISEGDEEDSRHASALMTPEAALTVINRLQRAVNMVLESSEDVPDVEREANRYAGPRAEPEDAP